MTCIAFHQNGQTDSVDKMQVNDTRSVKSNYWRKRTQVDGQIDWRMPAKGIYNLIRALSYPYPGAEFQFDGFKYIVMHSKVIKVKGFQNLEPGKVMSINSTGIVIKCGVDALLMDELESIPDIEVGEYL